MSFSSAFISAERHPWLLEKTSPFQVAFIYPDERTWRLALEFELFLTFNPGLRCEAFFLPLKMNPQILFQGVVDYLFRFLSLRRLME